MKSQQWFEKYPGLTFTLVIIFIVIFLDVISALFFIPTDYNSFRTAHPFYHHDLLPKQTTQNKWGEKIFDVYTNSFGFKDSKPREVSLTPSEKRILFMGDSFTEAVGMTWEESFAGLIDDHFDEVEILNAAVVSYSPKLYFLKTKFLIETKNLHFDELFVFIDNSDPLNEITYQDFKPYDNNWLKKTGIRLKKFLFRKSYIFHTISIFLQKNRQNEITESWNPMSGASQLDDMALEDENFIAATPVWSFSPQLYEKWGKTGLNLAETNMQHLVDLCSAHDIRVTVVIYPWPSHISKSKINDIQVEFWQKFCNKNRIGFINLFPAFFSHSNKQEILQKYFIPGDVHWNETGHQYIAELLIPYVHKINNNN